MVKINSTLMNENLTTNGDLLDDLDTLENFEESSNIIYHLAFSEYTEFFSAIIQKISQISNEQVKEQVERFFYSFLGALNNYYENTIIRDNISKVFLNEIEDGAVLIEWNFYNFKIGFCFEQEEKESNCYFIFDNEKMGVFSSKSIKLAKEKYENILIECIEFILQNA